MYSNVRSFLRRQHGPFSNISCRPILEWFDKVVNTQNGASDMGSSRYALGAFHIHHMSEFERAADIAPLATSVPFC